MALQPTRRDPWVKALVILMTAMAGTFCGGAVGLASVLRERAHRHRPPATEDRRRDIADEVHRLRSVGLEELVRLRAR